jgi:hypothetical protein
LAGWFADLVQVPRRKNPSAPEVEICPVDGCEEEVIYTLSPMSGAETRFAMTPVCEVHGPVTIDPASAPESVIGREHQRAIPSPPPPRVEGCPKCRRDSLVFEVTGAAKCTRCRWSGAPAPRERTTSPRDTPMLDLHSAPAPRMHTVPAVSPGAWSD